MMCDIKLADNQRKLRNNIPISTAKGSKRTGDKAFLCELCGLGFYYFENFSCHKSLHDAHDKIIVGEECVDRYSGSTSDQFPYPEMSCEETSSLWSVTVSSNGSKAEEPPSLSQISLASVPPEQKRQRQPKITEMMEVQSQEVLLPPPPPPTKLSRKSLSKNIMKRKTTQTNSASSEDSVSTDNLNSIKEVGLVLKSAIEKLNSSINAEGEDSNKSKKKSKSDKSNSSASIYNSPFNSYRSSISRSNSTEKDSGSSCTAMVATAPNSNSFSDGSNSVCVICNSTFISQGCHYTSSQFSLLTMKKKFCEVFGIRHENDNPHISPSANHVVDYFIRKEKYPFCVNCFLLVKDLCRREQQFRTSLNNYLEIEGKVLKILWDKVVESEDHPHYQVKMMAITNEIEGLQPSCVLSENIETLSQSSSYKSGYSCASGCRRGGHLADYCRQSKDSLLKGLKLTKLPSPLKRDNTDNIVQSGNSAPSDLLSNFLTSAAENCETYFSASSSPGNANTEGLNEGSPMQEIVPLTISETPESLPIEFPNRSPDKDSSDSDDPNYTKKHSTALVVPSTLTPLPISSSETQKSSKGVSKQVVEVVEPEVSPNSDINIDDPNYRKKPSTSPVLRSTPKPVEGSVLKQQKSSKRVLTHQAGPVLKSVKKEEPKLSPNSENDSDDPNYRKKPLTTPKVLSTSKQSEDFSLKKQGVPMQNAGPVFKSVKKEEPKVLPNLDSDSDTDDPSYRKKPLTTPIVLSTSKQSEESSLMKQKSSKRVSTYNAKPGLKTEKKEEAKLSPDSDSDRDNPNYTKKASTTPLVPITLKPVAESYIQTQKLSKHKAAPLLINVKEEVIKLPNVSDSDSDDPSYRKGPSTTLEMRSMSISKQSEESSLKNKKSSKIVSTHKAELVLEKPKLSSDSDSDSDDPSYRKGPLTTPMMRSTSRQSQGSSTINQLTSSKRVPTHKARTVLMTVKKEETKLSPDSDSDSDDPNYTKKPLTPMVVSTTPKLLAESLIPTQERRKKILTHKAAPILINVKQEKLPHDSEIDSDDPSYRKGPSATPVVRSVSKQLEESSFKKKKSSKLVSIHKVEPVLKTGKKNKPKLSPDWDSDSDNPNYTKKASTTPVPVVTTTQKSLAESYSQPQKPCKKLSTHKPAPVFINLKQEKPKLPHNSDSEDDGPSYMKGASASTTSVMRSTSKQSEESSVKNKKSSKKVSTHEEGPVFKPVKKEKLKLSFNSDSESDDPNYGKVAFSTAVVRSTSKHSEESSLKNQKSTKRVSTAKVEPVLKSLKKEKPKLSSDSDSDSDDPSYGKGASTTPVVRSTSKQSQDVSLQNEKSAKRVSTAKVEPVLKSIKKEKPKLSSNSDSDSDDPSYGKGASTSPVVRSTSKQSQGASVKNERSSQRVSTHKVEPVWKTLKKEKPKLSSDSDSDSDDPSYGKGASTTPVVRSISKQSQDTSLKNQKSSKRMSTHKAEPVLKTLKKEKPNLSPDFDSNSDDPSYGKGASTTPVVRSTSKQSQDFSLQNQKSTKRVSTAKVEPVLKSLKKEKPKLSSDSDSDSNDPSYGKGASTTPVVRSTFKQSQDASLKNQKSSKRMSTHKAEPVLKTLKKEKPNLSPDFDSNSDDPSYGKGASTTPVVRSTSKQSQDVSLQKEKSSKRVSTAKVEPVLKSLKKEKPKLSSNSDSDSDDPSYGKGASTAPVFRSTSKQSQGVSLKNQKSSKRMSTHKTEPMLKTLKKEKPKLSPDFDSDSDDPSYGKGTSTTPVVRSTSKQSQDVSLKNQKSSRRVSIHKVEPVLKSLKKEKSKLSFNSDSDSDDPSYGKGASTTPVVRSTSKQSQDASFKNQKSSKRVSAHKEGPVFITVKKEKPKLSSDSDSDSDDPSYMKGASTTPVMRSISKLSEDISLTNQMVSTHKAAPRLINEKPNLPHDSDSYSDDSSSRKKPSTGPVVPSASEISEESYMKKQFEYKVSKRTSGKASLDRGPLKTKRAKCVNTSEWSDINGQSTHSSYEVKQRSVSKSNKKALPPGPQSFDTVKTYQDLAQSLLNDEFFRTPSIDDGNQKNGKPRSILPTPRYRKENVKRKLIYNSSSSGTNDSDS